MGSAEKQQYTTTHILVELLRGECDSWREKAERLELDYIRQAFKTCALECEVQKLKCALREEEKKLRDYVALNIQWLASLSNGLGTIKGPYLAPFRYFVRVGSLTS